MPRNISIMLVEDNATYRKVISRALGRAPEMELVCQFGTAEIALRSLQDMSTRTNPDVILLDLNLPGISGLEALPFFHQALPDSKIIILTQSNREADVLEAISKGCAGYLLKSATNKQIKEGIHNVIEGGASLDPDVAGFILETMKNMPQEQASDISLTNKELEILGLLSEGFEQKGIAHELHITRNTVAYHIKHIYEKLEVPNAPAAVSKAFRKGILPNT